MGCQICQGCKWRSASKVIVSRSQAPTAICKGSGWYGGLAVSTNPGPFTAFRAAAAAAPAVTTGRSVGPVVDIAAVPAGANRHGDALDNAAMVVAGRVHAVVDGKVPANQVGSHGGVFARQCLGLPDGVGLVFPVIHAHDARVARGSAKWLVKRLRPAATSAETYMTKQ